MLETRPYMRVLRAQVRVYIETKQFDRCAYVILSGSQLLAVFYMNLKTLFHAVKPSLRCYAFVQVIIWASAFP